MSAALGRFIMPLSRRPARGPGPGAAAASLSLIGLRGIHWQFTRKFAISSGKAKAAFNLKL